MSKVEDKSNDSDDDEIFCGRVKVIEILTRLKKYGVDTELNRKLLEGLDDRDPVPENILSFFMMMFEEREKVLSERPSTSSPRTSSEHRGILRQPKKVGFTDDVKFHGIKNKSGKSSGEKSSKAPTESYPAKTTAASSSYTAGAVCPLRRNVVAQEVEGLTESAINIKKNISFLPLPATNYTAGVPVVRNAPPKSVPGGSNEPVILKHDLRVKCKKPPDDSASGSSTKTEEYDISILSKKPTTRSDTLLAMGTPKCTIKRKRLL